nr:MAG: hypothetical protein [Molluscum contagiosum virus]
MYFFLSLKSSRCCREIISKWLRTNHSRKYSQRTRFLRASSGLDAR